MVAAEGMTVVLDPQVEMAIGRVLVAWYQYTMSRFLKMQKYPL
jgi:hypothetical protein